MLDVLVFVLAHHDPAIPATIVAGAWLAPWGGVCVLALVALATWALLERRGRAAWRTETAHVVMATDGPYRASALNLPRTRAPIGIRLATLLALLGASATLPWVGVGLAEAVGARNPLVLAVALLLAGTGAWMVRASGGALSHRSTRGASFAWISSAAVIAVALGVWFGVLDACLVEVHGLKGLRAVLPLGDVLRNGGVFSSFRRPRRARVARAPRRRHRQRRRCAARGRSRVDRDAATSADSVGRTGAPCAAASSARFLRAHTPPSISTHPATLLRVRRGAGLCGGGLARYARRS